MRPFNVVLRPTVITVSTKTLSLSLQVAVYDKIMPFLPSSSGRFQESVTFLELILETEKYSGGTVGAEYHGKEHAFNEQHILHGQVVTCFSGLESLNGTFSH